MKEGNYIIFDHVLTIYFKKKRDLDTGFLVRVRVT